MSADIGVKYQRYIFWYVIVLWSINGVKTKLYVDGTGRKLEHRGLLIELIVGVRKMQLSFQSRFSGSKLLDLLFAQHNHFFLKRQGV